MSLSLIWAQARGGVIGADGTMPWHLPEDLAHFKDLTTGSTVVMGRRTWESFPARFRPLPGRRNIVLTRDPSWTADGAEPVHSLDEALARDPDPWIIGGAQLFAATIDRASRLEVTEIDATYDGDTFAPAIDFSVWVPTPLTADAPWLTSRTGLRYRFLTYALV
jgi:dihydrofolate reductase